jgi:hypothetical protein
MYCRKKQARFFLLMPFLLFVLISLEYLVWVYVLKFVICIQAVSEIRVLILISGRARQFMKLFSIIFSKVAKVFQDFLPPNFYQTTRFV